MGFEIKTVEAKSFEQAIKKIGWKKIEKEIANPKNAGFGKPIGILTKTKVWSYKSFRLNKAKKICKK